MAYDGSVKFDTKLDSSGLQSGLSSVTGSIGSACAKAAAAFASTAAAGAAAAVKVGSEFEASMSQVYAVSQATEEEAAALKQAAIDAGQSTQFSASQSADALQYLSLAGYSAEESIEALPKVLNLAAAGGMDLAYASDLLTDSMAVMGLGIEDMDNFSDQLATAASKSNTSVAQLGEAVLVCGGQAKTCGMDVTDMNTALGILADNGIKGSEGGTALRNTLKNLYTPTNSAAKVLEKLGIETSDSEGNLRDMQDVLIDLNDVLSEMSEADRTKAMGDIFDTRTIAAATALLDNCGERWSELEGYLSDCEGAASQMADTMNDNLAGKMKLVASAAEACGIALYDHLSEPLKEAADEGAKYLQELAKSLTSGELAGAAENIGEGLGKIVSAASNLVQAALPPLINILSTLCSNLDLVAAAAVTVGTSMAASLAFTTFTTWATGASKAIAAFSAAQKAAAATNATTTAGLGLLQAAYGVLKGKITATAAAQAVLNGLSPVVWITAAVAAIAVAVVAYRRYTKVTGEAAEKIEALNDANEEVANSVEVTAGKYDELTQAIKNAEDAYNDSIVASEAEAETAEALTDQLDELLKKENKSEAEKKLMADVVNRLNEILPDLKLNYDETTDSLSTMDGVVVDTTEHIRELISAMQEQARTKANLELYEEYTKQQRQVEIDMDGAADSLTTAQKAYNDAKAEYDKAQKQYSEIISRQSNSWNPVEIAQMEIERGKAATLVNETGKALKDAETNLNNAKETYAGYVTEWLNLGDKADKAMDGYVASAMGAEEATEETAEAVEGSIDPWGQAETSVNDYRRELDSIINDPNLTNDEKFTKISDCAKEMATQNANAFDIMCEEWEKYKQKTDEVDTSGAVEEIENVGNAAEGVDTSGAVTEIENVDAAADEVEFGKLTSEADELDLKINGFDFSPAVEEMESLSGAADEVDTSGAVEEVEELEDGANGLDFSDGINTIDEFKEKISELASSGDVEGIINALEEYVTNTGDWEGAIAAMVDNGFNLVEGLEEGIYEGINLPVEAVAEACNLSITTVETAWANVSELGLQFDNGLAQGIREGKSNVINAVADVCAAAVTEANEQLDINSPSKVMREVGGSFDEGMADGIERNTDEVADAAREMSGEAEEAVRDRLGIHSASVVMKEVGGYFDEGMAAGIEKGTTMVAMSAREMAEATQKACGEYVKRMYSETEDAAEKSAEAVIFANGTMVQSCEDTAEEMAEIVEELSSKDFQKELEAALSISAEALAENEEGATESYENLIDSLDRLLDAELITEKEYYAEMKKARDEYLAENTEEWLDATQELYEGLKDIEEDELKERKNMLDYYHDIEAINDEKYYAELEKLRDEYFEEGTDDWRDYTEKIIKYQKSQADEMVDAIEDAFDDMIDALEDARDALDDKKQETIEDVSGVGELFSTGTVELSNGEVLEYASWADMDKRREYIEGYFNTMQKLKDLLLSSGAELDDVNAFMEKVTENGVEEALLAANTLLNSGKALDTFGVWNDLSDFIEEQTELLYGADEAAFEEQGVEAAESFCEEVARILNERGAEVPETFLDIGEESGEKFGEKFCEKFNDAIASARDMLTSFYADLQASLDALSGGSYSSVYNFYSSGETVAQQLSAARNDAAINKFRYA